MADRVKYFLLGLLFLVVAGVIAYDRWNSTDDSMTVADEGTSGDDELDLATAPKPRPPTPPMNIEPGPETAPAPEPLPPEPRPPVERPPAREPEPVKVAPEPAPAAPPRKVHVVRSGETLESIAQRYYKSRKGIAWIVDANELTDKNLIFVNQKLVIPARKEMKRSRSATPAKRRSGPPSVYVVKPGETDLYAICRRFYGSRGMGARVNQVMELNHLWSAEVKPGTRLQLPPK